MAIAIWWLSEKQGGPPYFYLQREYKKKQSGSGHLKFSFSDCPVLEESSAASAPVPTAWRRQFQARTAKWTHEDDCRLSEAPTLKDKKRLESSRAVILELNLCSFTVKQNVKGLTASVLSLIEERARLLAKRMGHAQGPGRHRLRNRERAWLKRFAKKWGAAAREV